LLATLTPRDAQYHQQTNCNSPRRAQKKMGPAAIARPEPFQDFDMSCVQDLRGERNENSPCLNTNLNRRRRRLIPAHLALIGWTPQQSTCRRETRGRVEVGPLIEDLDSPDWSVPYTRTAGAAYMARRDLRGVESALQLLVDFIRIVIDSGIDPQAAHREFLKVREYYQLLGDRA
jgi:hypothetical protein